ncbi:desulfoferrodoxin family protein [Sandaracinus amylolyticus]|uniref:Superoxide reductase n=1 Tax=Sandaracinus amylolyticus TaxID=927083 RepID=A0A0F6SE64_9BACT|nr:desulfoferrodoxin family protein [Sandaracinus amylolyticus]AKF04649.1 Superoxide reductase [Sandaracinus amylolyticus]
MERRRFLRGSIVGAATLALPSAAVAQRGRGTSACPPARAEWSAEGALTGTQVADASALTEDERTHAPVLTLPERVRAGRPFDLVVQVGVRPHEMSVEHRIEWLEVRLDDRVVWVADLSPDVAYPIVRVPLALREPSQLIARARCNQHGVWMTRRAIQVT